MHFCFYLPCYRIQLILGILPHQRLYLYGFGIARAQYRHMSLADINNLSDAPVKIAVIASGVVLNKHHLSTFFQYKPLTCRVGVFWEVSFYLCIEGILIPGKLRKLVLIVVVCQFVMCRQTDISFLGLGDKCRLIALIEFLKILSCWFCLADIIEDVKKGSVFLTIYFFQLYRHIVYLGKSLGTEEIWGVVIWCKKTFVLWGHHRCQLLKVSYHQQLYSSKGLVSVAISPKYRIDGIEEVTAHH